MKRCKTYEECRIDMFRLVLRKIVLLATAPADRIADYFEDGEDGVSQEARLDAIRKQAVVGIADDDRYAKEWVGTRSQS
jgi:hypothetical protein